MTVGLNGFSEVLQVTLHHTFFQEGCFFSAVIIATALLVVALLINTVDGLYQVDKGSNRATILLDIGEV